MPIHSSFHCLPVPSAPFIVCRHKTQHWSRLARVISMPAVVDFIATTIVWLTEGRFPYVSAWANLSPTSLDGCSHRVCVGVVVVEDKIEEPEHFLGEQNHLLISHYYLSQQLFDCFHLIHSGGRGACNKNKASQIDFTLQMQSFL